jgi:PAS domain S-box-containing protein
MPDTKPLRILIAEDDAAINELVAILLTEAGHQVAGRAYHAREAVKLAGQERPDAILLDIVMPDPETGQEDREAGLWAAREIMAGCPAPVVLLTAHESPELLEQACNLGVGAYLVKPPRLGDLERAILIACARFADLTELRRVNARLRESEERFRLLFEHSLDGILLTRPGGVVLAANPAACRLFGRSEAEICRARREELADPADPRLAAAITEREAKGQLSAELTLLRRDGSHFPALVSSAIFLDSLGDRMTSMIIHDQTLHHRMEENLRQAHKMEGIVHVVGGVAHQFNNLLAAMMLNLSAMQLAPLAPDTKSSVKDLEELCQRGADIVRQLLAYSAQSFMHAKPLDLRELIIGYQGLLQKLAGANILVELPPPRSLPWVEADPGMLQQAFVALCLNARDAMPAGGILKLELEEAVLTPEDLAGRSRGARCGHFLRLSVSDTGRGMDAATLGRLFEPFFTTKDVGEGLGLGLAAVHGIIEQHAGWVEVESAPGAGTTFHLFLPARERVQTPAPAPTAPTPLARGKETILVVEDDPSLRNVTTKFLRYLGYQVLAAGGDVEAFDLWQKHQAEIDLLYTDQVLTGSIPGHALAEKLRADKPGLKVIITSGYSAELLQLSASQAEGLRFVPKPFPPEKLAAALRACLEEPAPARS